MRCRRGFTLIEVLIALMLLVVIMVIAYGIWVFVARTGTAAAWESGVDQQLAQADSRLRDFVQASSYPSFATPQGNVILQVDTWTNPTTPTTATTYYFAVGAATTNVDSGGVSADTVLLKFYRCQGGRTGIEGLPDSPAVGSKIEVYLKAPDRQTRDGSHRVADLYMREVPLAFGNSMDVLKTQLQNEPAQSGTPIDTLMAEDVNSVAITVTDNQNNAITASTDSRCTVTADIQCLEPTRSRTFREKKISVVTNTGVVFGAITFE